MSKNKNHLTKKGKLYCANICAVIAVILIMLIEIIAFRSISLFNYLFLLLSFVFLSLIVYYLSIIADTLQERNEHLKDLQNKK